MHQEAVRRGTRDRRVAALLLALLAAAACAPGAASAQHPERFALSAHGSLGVGGKLSECVDLGDDVDGAGVDSFFGCERPRNPLTMRLLLSPGLGLRLSYVGWRYVSLGLSATLRALDTAGRRPYRSTDIGLTVGARYPLQVGSETRLITPYLAFTGGLTILEDTSSPGPRLGNPGYHVTGVVGLEIEVRPGFGVYIESGVTHLSITVDSFMNDDRTRSHYETTATHAVINLGLRVAR